MATSPEDFYKELVVLARKARRNLEQSESARLRAFMSNTVEPDIKALRVLTKEMAGSRADAWQEYMDGAMRIHELQARLTAFVEAAYVLFDLERD